MSIEVTRHALLWCAVINYMLLAIWSILLVLPHEWLYRLSARRFRVTAEQFDTLNFAGIVVYKIGIFLLNLVPFLALTDVSQIADWKQFQAPMFFLEPNSYAAFMKRPLSRASSKILFATHPNLYWRGLEVVHAAIERGYLDRNEWEFYFVGRCLEEIQLPYGIRPHLVSNLGWSEYAALLRTVDIGLSLMNTPHPSYPPLDLAACGAVVVTNRHGNKRSLDQYSRNIITCESSVDDLANGVLQAVSLAADSKTRMDNYDSAELLRDWNTSL